MASESKIVDLMSRLTKLTVKDELQWSVSDPPEALTDGTNDVFPIYFQTSYKNQLIGLAQRRYQNYDGDRDRFTWDEMIILVFLDRRGRVVWESSHQTSALFTLFETVREKVADIDGLLGKLLSDADGDEL